MKRYLGGALALMCVTNAVPVQAAGAVTVTYDQRGVSFPDVQPVVEQSRTLVPLRPVFEAMGAKVEWQDATQQVNATLQRGGESMTFRMRVGSPYAVLDYRDAYGRAQSYVQQLDVGAQVIGGRTMIPLRAAAEAFGSRVEWNAATQHAALYATGSLKQSLPSFATYALRGDLFALKPQEVGAFFLTNQERVVQQKAPFGLAVDLSLSARAKSQDMYAKNYFDHVSPTFGQVGDMLHQFGIQWRSLGENIAAGYATPDAVVQGWMNSSGHRANILGSFAEIGVGYFQGNNGYRQYWTQQFVTRM